jgi:hypothetical protein
MIAGATTHRYKLPSLPMEQPDASLAMQTQTNAQREESARNLRAGRGCIICDCTCGMNMNRKKGDEHKKPPLASVGVANWKHAQRTK